MTPEQNATLERLRGDQVAWPAIFEADRGAVVVLLALGFEMRPGKTWSSQQYFPIALDLQSVRIEADGTETIIGETTMRRITP